jgi:hypothetical protein
MKLLIFVVLWCILAALCLPLALLVILLAPLVWLISIPFRMLAVVVRATFALISTILFLPSRLLGHKERL